MESDYVVRWIECAFQFMERRAVVVGRIIEAHRAEFGDQVREPSIDAVCLSMVGLAALAKFRCQHEVGRTNYGRQFRQLLRNYCGELFSDRLSIPELIGSDPYKSLTQVPLGYGRRERFTGAIYAIHRLTKLGLQLRI